MEHPRGTPAAVRCLGLVPAGQGDTKVLPMAMGWVTSVAFPHPRAGVLEQHVCPLCHGSLQALARGRAGCKSRARSPCRQHYYAGLSILFA